MKNRPISEFMTPHPHSVGKGQPLSKAHELMREHKIRHLPVLEAGRIVGLLSQRDLHLIETLSDVDPTEVTVEEAMSQEPYTVAPTTPLSEVAGEMARRKLGATVIADGAHVVGMFTTVDALEVLQKALA